MGKTSSTVKNRYNAKAYDRIEIVVPKGQKDIIKAHAASIGESVNAFIFRAITQAMETDSRTGDTPAAAWAEIEKESAE